jgi:hypothetical protein
MSLTVLLEGNDLSIGQIIADFPAMGELTDLVGR